jgi:thiamine biosynthesis lipoprotein
MGFFNVPFKAMGTQCQIRLLADSQAQAQHLAEPAIAVVSLLEQRYSRYLPSSILSRINANAGKTSTDLDSETHGLLSYAARAFEQSDGLFDVTSGVLRRAWNFRKQGVSKDASPIKEIPSRAKVAALLKKSGWQNVDWSGGSSVKLPAGFELDFGGFVKEYAADAAKTDLLTRGVNIALVDLGGDIAVVGGDWPIAIKNPQSPSKKLLQINLQAGGLATSGNYERYFMHRGKRYSHILNPLTGWPVVTPASVSVVADTCLVAGTVSTVAMLAGEVGCLDYLESFGLPYCCVFNDGRVVNCF